MPDPSILTVSELTSEIRFNLSNEFSGIWVSGEISGHSKPSSGHQYFTLKDKSAQISCVVWRSSAYRIKFDLQNGLHIVCNGNIDVYPQRGSYQLNVQSAQPVGEGALQLAFRQLREKLEKEGLFDPSRKKRLPRFPRRIAVITSPTGAAVRDFLQVLDRRWSNLDVTIVPVKVQGPGSALEIAGALKSISEFANPPDVVVLTRGGGSIEDLWSFNEETVCRAIAECPIPTICGVGHEIDVTLSDLTADVRALTPSEAAERLIPQKNDVIKFVEGLRNRLRSSLLAKHETAKQQLEMLAGKPVMTRPLDRIHWHAQELDRLEAQAFRAMKGRIATGNHEIKEMAARLETINPLSVLARGYSLTSDADGNVLSNANSIQPGDTIHTRLNDGQVISEVKGKTKSTE